LATTITTKNDPNYIQAATAIQSQLKEVGIDVKINIVDFSKLDNMFTQVGWQGLALAPVISGYDVAYLGQFVFLMPTAFLLGNSIIHPDDISSLLPTVLAAPNDATKKSLTYQLDSLMMDKYQLFTALWLWPSVAAKYNYVKDDHVFDYELKEWYPENIWLDK
jgi:ABC-type transport system substrate-binding protein